MFVADQLLNQQLTALLTGEHYPSANLANASALIMQTVKDLNWVGFYLYDRTTNELRLGPFQGQVACMHIKIGHGVCGTAARDRQVKNVADVTTFPGYISCDATAQSELVIPMIKKDGQLFGVLDLDAPVKNRFNDELRKTLTRAAEIVMKSIDD